ncbi:hypothetical protein Cgig2_016845 [Carnegiea gigantea]|uniref:K-box domain-containing protein n=1 Tax=Carnegiea gigantea TaxID=171969 RepID=A0A9Q1JNR8_9CARY|nr:hypothetical protein Cgig2_016845 [Carnegiea gigantea]
MQQFKEEAAALEKKIKCLEASKRKLLGEALDGCSIEELQQLEIQLDKSLSSIRAQKDSLFRERIAELHEALGMPSLLQRDEEDAAEDMEDDSLMVAKRLVDRKNEPASGSNGAGLYGKSIIRLVDRAALDSTVDQLSYPENVVVLVQTGRFKQNSGLFYFIFILFFAAQLPNSLHPSRSSIRDPCSGSQFTRDLKRDGSRSNSPWLSILSEQR